MTEPSRRPTEAMLRIAALKRFLYDPSTGVFTYKVRTRASSEGAIAGSRAVGGYLEVSLLSKAIHLHRLAWLIHYGHLPEKGMHIDHIDGNRTNNAIANLRVVTPAENGQNRPYVNSNSTSGVPGVHWYKAYGKWSAEIMVSRKKHHLGYFSSIGEAAAARAAAKAKFHIAGAVC